MIMKEVEHIKFLRGIDKQINNLVLSPEEERYSRLVYIAKQLIDYKKETWRNIF